MKKSIIYLSLVLATCFQIDANAQFGPPPGGGGVGGPVEGPKGPNGDPIGPASPLPDHTPPCTVSDNCKEEPNYMPVWRYNAITKTVDQCPSPLFVRKDLYTCQRISRIFGVYEDKISLDPNAQFVNNCPKCNIGYVGINAIIPEEQLHVIGNIKCENGLYMGDIATKYIYSNDITNDPDGIPNSGDEEVKPIEFKSDVNFLNLNAQYVGAANGNFSSLSVGNLSTNYLTTSGLTNNGDLTVKGVLRIKNASGVNVFRIDQNGYVRSRRNIVDILTIPDYVFKKGYKLMPLKELEEFITQKNHLPNIKSEEEYKTEGGIDLGELNMKLLEKVEELTLHLIELNKKIEKLESKKK
jgi:hypothetical protein